MTPANQPVFSTIDMFRISSSNLTLQSRAAFSLIEVIVAMGIVLMGLAAVLQMSNLSQSFAKKASEATELQILCQNRMSEILAGLAPPETVNEQRCPENEQLEFSVEIEPHEELPLALVTVTVRPARDESSGGTAPTRDKASKASQRREARERQFVLRRWIPLSAPAEETQKSETLSPERASPLPPSLPTAEEERP